MIQVAKDLLCNYYNGLVYEGKLLFLIDILMNALEQFGEQRVFVIRKKNSNTLIDQQSI